MLTPIPSLIKRNTALLALSLSFSGAGIQFAYGFGPLMVISLTGSSALAGLSVGLIGLSRFLIAYPIGRIADGYGRRRAVHFGLSVALVGCFVLAAAMATKSVFAFIFGFLIFGMGMNASQQMRVAATDMYPTRMRAQALGFVALGSLFGLVLSPPIVQIGEWVGRSLNQDPLGMPWLFLPVLILAGMGIVTLVRPDPLEIAMNLGQYFPNEGPVRRTGGATATTFHLRTMLRDPFLRLAIVSNAAASGNMAIVMVLTSLVLSEHGHTLFWIAISNMFHSAGMFAFTIPLGRLADRFGRLSIMIPGVATTLVGASLLSFTASWSSITIGTFLVGIGWAAANVSATAMIADHAAPEERGRAIGFNDTVAGASSVFAACVTGPVLQWSGLPATGWTAVLLAALPFTLIGMLPKKTDSVPL